MSHWDSGRPADGQYDAPQPSWPDGTSYPYPLPFPLSQALDAEDELWLADGLRAPGEGGQPGDSRYPGDSRDGDERAREPAWCTAGMPNGDMPTIQSGAPRRPPMASVIPVALRIRTRVPPLRTLPLGPT
jgi:hypothetical protein